MPMEEAVEGAEHVLAGPAILRSYGIEKSFGKHRVLRGVNLEVREGDVYGFLGRNGAGKTTTLRGIMGIQGFDSGEVELFGTRVTRATREQKRQIGYVSQEQHFYPWMSCANLGRFVAGFFPSWDAAEFERLLVALDLPPARKVFQLSGGMRAKLGLALALAHRPRLLLLDEPTTGLDPAARREFLEIVTHQARTDGRTTFFSSHIVEEVERVSTRVGILDSGRIRYEGSLDGLRESVRRVVFPANAEADTPAFEIPEGFECLSDETREGGVRCAVLFAPTSLWTGSSLEQLEFSPMTVEDIFLALTVARLASA